MVIFMKLKEVYEEYINFTPLSRRTKEIYKYYFERFWLDRIGDIEICDLSYDIVQEGFNSLVKRYSYNTIKTYKSALIKVVEIAELKEGIVVNWKKHLYLGQRNAKKRYNANSMNEFIELMKHLYKCRSKNKKSYILACWIGFFTGARLGDDDDKIRLNQRKPSKYKGLRRFGPEKKLATNQQIYEGKAYLL